MNPVRWLKDVVHDIKFWTRIALKYREARRRAKK